MSHIPSPFLHPHPLSKPVITNSQKKKGEKSKNMYFGLKTNPAMDSLPNHLKQ
jgi:hypothetical protein